MSNNNDKKISELSNTAPLTGAELVPVVQDGITKKTVVSDIVDLTVAGLGDILNQPTIVERLPENIKIGTAVLPAGGTHTYTIDLGEVYQELLITSFEWVQPSARNDVPLARLGQDSFPSNVRKYNFTLKVKQGAGNSQRLFVNPTDERSGASATPVAGRFGATVSEVGVALGYGLAALSAPLDHIATFGKKIEISDIYLESNNLIVIVKNHESESIELNPYLGITASILESAPANAILTRINVFDTNSLMVLSGSFYNARILISHDNGANFSYLTNDDTIGYFLGSTAKGVQNDFFVGLLSHGYSTIRIVEGNGLLASNVTEFSTGLQATDQSMSFPTAENFRHSDYSRSSSVWPNTGRNLDALDKNLLVFTSFTSGLGRVDRVTNLSTMENILKIEDVYPDVINEFGIAKGSNYHDYSSYIKLVDADTYFVSFCQYDQTYRNCLVKTVDGGQTWQKLLESHVEFVNAITRVVSVSDGGQELSIVVFVPGFDVPGIPPELKGKALFNYSTDGGQTWQFNSLSWPIIASSEENTMNGSLFNNPASSTSVVGAAALYQANGSFLLIIADNENRPRIFRSLGGEIWTDGEILSSLDTLHPQQRSGLGFDANQNFIAFGAYGYMGVGAPENRVWTGAEIETFTNYLTWGLK